MLRIIFYLVAYSLALIAKLTNLTYNQINIIVYYMLIPFSWLALVDSVFGVHYFKLGFGVFLLGFFVGCRNFKAYSDWLFFKSVDFLKYFNRFGSNYISSSVWICVALPVFIYALLIYLAFYWFLLGYRNNRIRSPCDIFLNFIAGNSSWCWLHSV